MNQGDILFDAQNTRFMLVEIREMNENGVATHKTKQITIQDYGYKLEFFSESPDIELSVQTIVYDKNTMISPSVIGVY